jgi:hypothetical protein
VARPKRGAAYNNAYHVGSRDYRERALRGRASPSVSDELLHALRRVRVKFVTIILAIASNNQKQWRLQLTLGDSFAFDNVKRPMIAHLPADLLFAWCHAHPDVAPSFVAGIVSVLTHRDRDAPPPDLDRLTRRLLDEFGDREDVLRAINSNIHSFGWSGSRTSYYQLYEHPLKSLEKHPIGAVRRWAKKMLVAMQREFEAARDEDDELKASWGD